MALQAISRMETRKYTNESRRNSSLTELHKSFDTLYSCTRWPCYDIKSCAICLEEFTEGQVRSQSTISLDYSRYRGAMVLWLSMLTHNAGVVSSMPPCVTFKTPLVRKATGIHLIKSTSLEETQIPVSGFCYARNRVVMANS